MAEFGPVRPFRHERVTVRMIACPPSAVILNPDRIIGEKIRDYFRALPSGSCPENFI